MSAAVMPLMPSWYTSPATTRHAEGDRGDDGGLGRGVVALDVGGGVPLGEAQALGLGQGVGVGRRPASVMRREDVVGGAVDDAHHPADGLAHQRLAQRPHQRDAAGHRGLEQQVHARRRRPPRTARRRRWPAAPCWPVTTGLPAASAARMSSRAGSMPPMTSTTTSMAGSATTAAASRVSTPSGSSTSRCRGQVAHRHPGHLEAHAGAGRDGVAPLGDQRHQGAARRCRTRAPRPAPRRRTRRSEATAAPSTLPGSHSADRSGRRGAAGRRRSRGAPRRGPGRRPRTPPPGGAPCCSCDPMEWP